MAENWKTKILDLLFPPKCVFCGRLIEHSGICPTCESKLRELGQPESRTLSDGVFCVPALRYEDVVRESILRFKFEQRDYYAEEYGKLMVRTAALELANRFELVTWVPVSKKRKRERGYDQSELLAKELCASWGVTLLRTLEKTVHNDAQSSMESAERRRVNVLGVYKAVNREQFAGKRLLLVDDILTTGSTVSEAARVLRLAGAEAVSVLTLAAAEERK